MSIFGNIIGKIFGHHEAQAKTPAQAAPAAPRPAATPRPAVAPPAAATPANTRIALMMIAAFVMSVTPSEYVEFRAHRVAERAPSAGQAKAKPR